MKRPHILIPLPAHNSIAQPTYGLKQAYIHAIAKAGGEPLCIVRPSDEHLHELLPFTNGIFIVGGHDIDSEYYGEENTGHTQHIDHDRDQVELALVRFAVKRRIPLLGICRGMQAINVALGGSLYQDVESEMPGALHHDYHKDKETGKDLAHSLLAHDVSIKENTLLSQLSGKGKLAVNSLHHQGVKTLGKDLVASAQAPDGLIEAIELPLHPFALGVEWHPEELNDEVSQKIFTAFVAAAMKG